MNQVCVCIEAVRNIFTQTTRPRDRPALQPQHTDRTAIHGGGGRPTSSIFTVLPVHRGAQRFRLQRVTERGLAPTSKQFKQLTNNVWHLITCRLSQGFLVHCHLGYR